MDHEAGRELHQVGDARDGPVGACLGDLHQVKAVREGHHAGDHGQLVPDLGGGIQHTRVRGIRPQAAAVLHAVGELLHAAAVAATAAVAAEEVEGVFERGAQEGDLEVEDVDAQQLLAPGNELPKAA